jgi:hypothetical protein
MVITFCFCDSKRPVGYVLTHCHLPGCREDDAEEKELGSGQLWPFRIARMVCFVQDAMTGSFGEVWSVAVAEQGVSNAQTSLSSALYYMMSEKTFDHGSRARLSCLSLASLCLMFGQQAPLFLCSLYAMSHDAVWGPS